MNLQTISPYATIWILLTIIAGLCVLSVTLHIRAGIRVHRQADTNSAATTSAQNIPAVPSQEDVFRTNHPVLTVRPPLGTKVVLLKEDSFLREYCDAVPGTTGTVVAHSALHGPDRDSDQGVLVLWASSPIDTVRIELDEIALV